VPACLALLHQPCWLGTAWHDETKFTVSLTVVHEYSGFDHAKQKFGFLVLPNGACDKLNFEQQPVILPNK